MSYNFLRFELFDLIQAKKINQYSLIVTLKLIFWSDIICQRLTAITPMDNYGYDGLYCWRIYLYHRAILS